MIADLKTAEAISSRLKEERWKAEIAKHRQKNLRTAAALKLIRLGEKIMPGDKKCYQEEI